MKKILLLISITIGLFALTSCLDGPNGGGDNPKLKNGFRINVDVEQVGTELVTRSTVAPEPGEEDLQNLYLLFFDRTENQSGVFKGHHAITSGLVMNTDIDINFDASSGLMNTAAYNVLAVSNISDDKYLDKTVDMWLTSLVGKTEKQVAEATRGYLTGLNDGNLGAAVEYNKNHIMPSGIIMSGRGFKEANQERLELTLKRGLTRFDVVNAKKEDYNMVSVSIWNVYPETPMWEGAGIDFNRARMERFYGITTTKINDTDPDSQYNDILGGLYSFENYVTLPELNDINTTCLIIGMENRTSGERTFYRVNLHPKESGQSLKRNKVYRLTIRGVIDAGATTEMEAFKNNENKLSFVINYWDLDSDGMIQYDGNNILGLPAKSIHLAPEGETREYSVFTFGEGTLSLTQKILDQGLTVDLVGNTLTVKSTALNPGEEERKGIIEVSFGSLKASINIRQSGAMDLYLELSVSSIDPFPSYTNASMTGGVIVKASGKWRARIFPPGDERFTFRNNEAKYEITSDDTEATGGQFRISTRKNNDENTLAYGFVLVELIDSPTTNRTLLLTQLGKSDITYEPATVSEARFEPSGTFVESATNKNVFTINSGIEVVNPETFYDWKAEMIGIDADKFTVAIEKDLNLLSGNKITITAKGANSESRALVAQVKMSLVNNPSVSITINVKQATYSFSLFPSTLAKIGVRGGQSDLVEAQGDNSLHWKANITMTHIDDDVSKPGTLKDHVAYLVGENGDKLVLGQSYPMSTKFKVVYPMVYFPNTHMTPSAKVTLTLVESPSTSAEISASQAPLLPRTVIAQSFNGGYSTLFLTMAVGTRGNYFEGAMDAFKNPNIFGPDGVVRSSRTAPYVYTSYYGTSGAIPSNVTWAHANSANNWSTNYQAALIAWQDESKANWVWAFPEVAAIAAFNPFLTGKGYNYGGAAVIGNAVTTTVRQTTVDAELNSKVGKYIFETGPFCQPGDAPIRGLAFAADATNSTSSTTPVKAHVLIRGTPLYDSSRAMLTIDIENRMIVCGEGQMFDYPGINIDLERARTNGAAYPEVIIPQNAKTKMLRNVQAFMFNAVQYGDHFTDTFKE